MAVVFLVIHVLTSILDTYVHIGWIAVFMPFSSPYGRFWVGLGTIALDLMMAVFISSLLRAHLRPGTWRGIHWLAYASWPVALAHTFGLGTDSREHWVILLGALCVSVRRPLSGVAHVRSGHSNGGSGSDPLSRFHSPAMRGDEARGGRHDVLAQVRHHRCKESTICWASPRTSAGISTPMAHSTWRAGEVTPGDMAS